MKNLGMIFLILMTLAGSLAHAREADREYMGPPHWNEFKQFVIEQQEEDHKLGLSYMISGVIASVGGTIGFFNTQDIFSQSMYAVASTVGLAAIGLGATYYWTGNPNDSFYYAIENTSLSAQQRNEVLGRYLERERQEQNNRKWIRVVTHSLIAAFNFYSAVHEDNHDVKSVFYFLGAANTVLAVTYAF